MVKAEPCLNCESLRGLWCICRGWNGRLFFFAPVYNLARFSSQHDSSVKARGCRLTHASSDLYEGIITGPPLLSPNPLPHTHIQYVHKHTHRHRHTHIHIHAHTDIDTHRYKRTHTHTHTHTHTQQKHSNTLTTGCVWKGCFSAI